ncbi:MAG: hypothetical protein EAZ95_11975 [Bacteroidetes bacterium]|nr:MAG: hypothetical protein EAZ95_11975 [Bacteroidota bacterium]
MGHHITAIVTPQRINAQKAKEYDLFFVVEKSFSILFLDEFHSDFWAEKLQIEDKENDFHENKIILDCKTTLFLAGELGIDFFVLLNTDYFAGIGEQWACVYRAGKKIMPDTCSGINEALRKIGVQAEKGLDEFDTINLVSYRGYDTVLLKHAPDLYEKWQKVYR